MLGTGEVIEIGDLPPEIRGSYPAPAPVVGGPVTLPQPFDELERVNLLAALAVTGGNRPGPPACSASIASPSTTASASTAPTPSSHAFERRNRDLETSKVEVAVGPGAVPRCVIPGR
jgi:hypothetical protein